MPSQVPGRDPPFTNPVGASVRVGFPTFLGDGRCEEICATAAPKVKICN